jgi:hypothetical protein
MIHETNDNFPFSNLALCKPISQSGGNFFIRYALSEQPLYIQPPKCYIKHIKTNKKTYCDLVFQQENEAFLRWMETLENKTQQMLYENRTNWFQTDLEKEDIEQSFTSPMKIYKSGKEYIVRTSIPSRGGKSALKVYDEDENDIPIENITENTKVMVILEIQGVRSSSCNFQIDIEIKQMMVLKTEEIFNKCIFKKKSDTAGSLGIELPKSIPAFPRLTEPESSVSTESMNSSQKTIETPEELASAVQEKIATKEDNGLCEINFDLDEIPPSDTICLKERKEMYYKMYEEARQKAKVARDLALSAYLEANRIKNKYMLDDVLDSSSSDESADFEEGEDEDDDENKDE